MEYRPAGTFSSVKSQVDYVFKIYIAYAFHICYRINMLNSPWTYKHRHSCIYLIIAIRLAQVCYAACQLTLYSRWESIGLPLCSLCVCMPCGKTSKCPPEVPVMPTVCRVQSSVLHGQSLLIFCRGDTGLAPVPKFMCQACAVKTTGLYSQCEWGGKLMPLPGAVRKACHPNSSEFLLTDFLC